jgi:hypothetical protein
LLNTRQRGGKYKDRSELFQKGVYFGTVLEFTVIYTLFGRGTVKVCVGIYRDSMCAPFVTPQTLILCFISCHSHSSMSAVTDAAATKMCRLSSSVSVGKGGTYAKPVTCPRESRSHGVGSWDIGGPATLSEESPSVRVEQSSGLVDAK